jgi:hypothetical protein
VSIIPMLANIRCYYPHFLDEDGVVDIGRTLELASIAGKAGKKLSIIYQVIFKS